MLTMHSDALLHRESKQGFAIFRLLARGIVERGIQGVPQVPGLDFSGGPKFWKFHALYLYKDEKVKKWYDLAFLLLFCIIIY